MHQSEYNFLFLLLVGPSSKLVLNKIPSLTVSSFCKKISLKLNCFQCMQAHSSSASDVTIA